MLLVVAFITRDKEKRNPDEPVEVVEEVDTGVKTVQQAVTVEETEEEPEGLTEIDGVLYTEGGGRSKTTMCSSSFKTTFTVYILSGSSIGQ